MSIKKVEIISSEDIYCIIYDIAEGDNCEGCVIAMNTKCMIDSKKEAKFQLGIAQSGFGCSPNSSGRAVFVKFLDGETARVNREELLGVVKKEVVCKYYKGFEQRYPQLAK